LGDFIPNSFVHPDGFQLALSEFAPMDENRYSNGLSIHGPIFRTFFSAENHFPRKIPRNFLEKRFFKAFFRGKFNFFPTFLGENFPRNFPRNFPWKKCTKNRPLVEQKTAIGIFTFPKLNIDCNLFKFMFIHHGVFLLCCAAVHAM
jgi:hypothetical protein